MGQPKENHHLRVRVVFLEGGSPEKGETNILGGVFILLGLPSLSKPKGSHRGSVPHLLVRKRLFSFGVRPTLKLFQRLLLLSLLKAIQRGFPVLGDPGVGTPGLHHWVVMGVGFAWEESRCEWPFEMGVEDVVTALTQTGRGPGQRSSKTLQLFLRVPLLAFGGGAQKEMKRIPVPPFWILVPCPLLVIEVCARINWDVGSTSSHLSQVLGDLWAGGHHVSGKQQVWTRQSETLCSLQKVTCKRDVAGCCLPWWLKVFPTGRLFWRFSLQWRVH